MTSQKPRPPVPLRTSEAIKNLFHRLNPRGKIWVIVGKIDEFFDGMSLQFFRNRELKVKDLINNADPRTAEELIDDWEEELQVPNQCTGQPITLAERQQMVHAKLVISGGQSRAYFIEIAKNFGFKGPGGFGDPVIYEFAGDIFTCISFCNDFLYGPQHQWIWEMRVDTSPSQEMRDALECQLERLKPAHTEVRFTYT